MYKQGSTKSINLKKYFFFELTLTSFQEPETGVGHLYNIPVPTNVTGEYGSGLCAEATVVQLIHFLTCLQNLLVFWKIYIQQILQKVKSQP